MKDNRYEPERVERADDYDNSDSNRRSASSGRSGPSVALIASLVVAGLAVAFFFRNSQKAEIDFLFTEKQSAVRWSLLIAVGIGIVLDRLVSVWWRRMRQRRR